MAESNVVKLEVEPSREKLVELLSDTRKRLVGIMGFCEALSTGETSFQEEACAEMARILDDICGAIDDLGEAEAA